MAFAVVAFASRHAQGPAIGKIAPTMVKRGAQITISGHGFVPGKRNNVVVFRGGGGARDDVKVRATTAPRSTKIVLSAPPAQIVKGGPGAVSGPLQVINRNGISRPSSAVLRFDDDGDGVPNEREIKLGTNPESKGTPALDTIIDSAAHGTTNDSTPTFQFHATVAGSTFECSIDQGTASFGPCSGPGAVHTPASALADGSYTFRVRAIDPTNHIDPTAAAEAFTVDTTVPDTIIDSAAHGTTNDPTPTFQFHATEPGTFECSIDKGTPSFSPCSGPGATHTPAPLADGAYTFRVRAIDQAGNSDSTPATESFTVDSSSLDTIIDSAAHGTTNDSTPTFQFHATVAGSTFECSIDQGSPSFSACSGPGATHTPAPLADGSYTFRVRAIDPTNHIDPTAATEAFSIDTSTNFICNHPGSQIAGSGLTSTFEGFENVTAEARSKIGHDAYGGLNFEAVCLLRKQLGDADSNYQVVRSSGLPDAGVLSDGQRPAKGTDYVFRTDVVTTAGYIPGFNTLTARGAASVANVDGWGQFEENCTQCGSTSVQAGALRSTVKSSDPGGAGENVGEVATYKDPVELAWHPGDPDAQPNPIPPQGTKATTRVLVPLIPSVSGTHIAAQLNLSVDHPDIVRNDVSGTVADVHDSSNPWISVELRTYADGSVRVVARDSASSALDHLIAESPDLSTAGLQSVYMNIQLTAPDRYEVTYLPNTADPPDLKLDLDPDPGVEDRALPGPMPEAWLSLSNEMSRAEVATHDVRFDEADAVYQADYNRDWQESFGGASANVQLPAGFNETQVVSDLLAPTAIDFADNGDMYIALRDGKVMRLNQNAPEGPGNAGSLGEVLDITDLVNSGPNDHGLTGFVLDPNFDTNGYFYVYYTVQKADTFGDRTVSRVERFHVDPVDGTAHRDDPARKILVGADAPAPDTGDPATNDTCPPGPTSDCLPSDHYTHSSGDLVFGSDGTLWISTPDGGTPDGLETDGTDHLSLRAINPDSLAGKILRVDPATGDGVPGNPNYDASAKRSPASRIWAMGFRNPFRIAERPNAPGSWYATDVGWGAWEELDVIPGTATAGAVPNYGWPCYEGTPESVYKTLYPTQCNLSNPISPLNEYDSSGVDHAIIGSTFYTGSAFPSPWKADPGQAAFYYGDYPSGDITMVKTDASDHKLDVQAFGGGFTSPVMLTEGPVNRADPNGEQTLYLVDLGPIDQPTGRIWRITYDGP